jgi:O-succinylbenzoate synthase
MGVRPGGRQELSGNGLSGNGLVGIGLVGIELVGVELVRVSLPLGQAWVSEGGSFSERDSLLVRAVLSCPVPGGGKRQVEGWGECAALPGPTYSSEYTAAALAVSVDYLVPAVLRAGAARPVDVGPAVSRVRGHKMAKAAFEAAVLDAALRSTGTSMAAYFEALSQDGMPRRAAVAGGVAVGLKPSTAELVDEVGRYVEQGYRRVKLKIVPGRDVAPVSAVRQRWPDLALFADANGSYRQMPFADVVNLMRGLEPFDLECIEQPLGEEDLAGHAALARTTRLPICLDEPLTSVGAVVAALDLGACSVVSVKAGRLGGYLEAVLVHDLCAQRQVPVWCGGMVETGIARAANVALSALPNFSLAGDLSATGRFFETDLTTPISLQADGTIAVPDGPGSGVTVDEGAVNAFATWRRWFPASG